MDVNTSAPLGVNRNDSLSAAHGSDGINLALFPKREWNRCLWAELAVIVFRFEFPESVSTSRHIRTTVYLTI
jgi:hypothetical protein